MTSNTTPQQPQSKDWEEQVREEAVVYTPAVPADLLAEVIEPLPTIMTTEI